MLSFHLVCVESSGGTSSVILKQADDGGFDDTDLSDLNVEPEYHTGRPTYKCPRCDKQFPYISQMRQHVRFHLKHRPFQCPVCSKAFVQSSNLTEHLRIHTDERPFACDLCSRRFRQSSNLNYHIRTAHNPDNTSPGTAGDPVKADKSAKRSEPKLFSCEHCDRRFTQACRLSRHALSHSSDSPYRCPFCQKAFNYASNLSEHLRTHTGEKPFECAACGRSFAQSSQLKVHMKSRHPNANGDAALTVVCPVCSLRFSGLRALNNHLKLQHGASADSRQSTKSSKCSKRSATKVGRRRKSLSPSKYSAGSRKSVTEGGSPVGCPYVCCHCEMGFMTQGRLVMHLWSHEYGISPQSTPLMNVRIKAELESPGASGERAVTVSPRSSRRASADRLLRCPHCSKLFTHRRKWKVHVEMHETGRCRSRTKKPVGPAAGTRRRSKLRGRLNEGKNATAASAVKVENGGAGDYAAINSPNASSDEDDNTGQVDSGPGSDSPQQMSLNSALQLLASAVAAGSRKKRVGKKRSEQTTAAASSTPQRTYPCSECDRVMSSPAALHYHRRTHSGVKPFACSVCPRRFLIRGQLVEHERIHSGEKPFACDQCPKRFAQSSQRRQHASVHNTVGTHVCTTCGEAFTRPWRLASHRRAAHAESDSSAKRYRCDDCGREYTLRQSWVYHRLTHSSDRPFRCDACPREFRVIGQLRQHANHCRGRRQPAKPATDLYQQPPQHWAWYSDSASDLLAEAVASMDADDGDTSVFDAAETAAGSNTTQELTAAEFQQL